MMIANSQKRAVEAKGVKKNNSQKIDNSLAKKAARSFIVHMFIHVLVKLCQSFDD